MISGKENQRCRRKKIIRKKKEGVDLKENRRKKEN